MKLYTPSHEEAVLLLKGPTEFRGWYVRQEALPPAFIFAQALASTERDWRMPRLFCDEERRQILGSGAFKSGPIGGKIALGYGVSPLCRGRGYATAGVRLMLEEAFLSGLVDTVLADTSPENRASQRVLEKAGFVRCGSGVNDEGPAQLWSKKMR
jgi:RimJ/RimL family protein N-acetyltransferase